MIQSTCVVVGKVTKIEKAKKTGADGQEYEIAVVKIEQAVKGAKDLTHVRVGYRSVVGRRGQPFAIALGSEGCFFLTQNAKEDFLRPTSYFGFHPKSYPNFKKDIETLKQTQAVLANPMAVLTKGKPDEKYLAAALLITKYRTYPTTGGTVAQEPIDPKESKLILETLAKADWKKVDPKFSRMPPLSMFYRLAITEKDGFQRPKDFTKMVDEAKKWVADNADSYRIKRFVSKKK